MSRSASFSRLVRLFARASARKSVSLSGAGGPSRRDLLRGGAGATALWSLAPLTYGGCATVAHPKVVVVGAGIAGLHCAWRLSEAGVDVSLYEASDRVGGRMFTGRDLFSNGHLCELGGELIDTNHATMWALAEELEVDLDDRIEAAGEGTSVDTWFVGGTVVSDETIVASFEAVLANFTDALDAAESDDVAFDTLDQTTLQDWIDTNIPSADHPELHAVIAAAYRGEFGLENHEQSALNMIYLIGLDTETGFRIFGDSDERYHTHAGNDAYTDAIAAKLPAESIRTGHTLTALHARGDAYSLHFDTADGPVEVDADHVVLALPFSTLRHVDTTEVLSEEKRTLIDTLGYGTNAKVMGEFTAPVWRRDHDASGSSTSDLPVQQTWDSSLGQTGDGAILTNFLGGLQGITSGSGTAEDWFTSVLNDIDTIYPGAEAAYVAGSAVRMHWPTVATAKGSYTCYKPGQWATWSTEGVREGNVHFCGEHTSADFQGWMEGAAETGGFAAAEVLDDLGQTHPEGLRRSIGAKLQRRQPGYHEGRSHRREVFARRRGLGR